MFTKNPAPEPEWDRILKAYEISERNSDQERDAFQAMSDYNLEICRNQSINSDGTDD